MNDPKFQAGINRAIRRLAEHSPDAVVWETELSKFRAGHADAFPGPMYAAAWEAFCKVLNVDVRLRSAGRAFGEWALAPGNRAVDGQQLTRTDFLVGYIREDPATMALLDNFYGSAVQAMRVQRGFTKEGQDEHRAIVRHRVLDNRAAVGRAVLDASHLRRPHVRRALR